jgi:hypothetical protein
MNHSTEQPYQQLKAIIAEIMANEDYPTWDSINGVLTSRRKSER